VGLAHADPAVEEQRVVTLRGVLGDGAGGGMRELVAGADHESVETVLGIELGSGVEIEARLRSRARRAGRGGASPLRRLRREAVAHGSGRGIVLFGDELHVLELQAEVVDGLQDEVHILFFDDAEFRPGHADV